DQPGGGGPRAESRRRNDRGSGYPLLERSKRLLDQRGIGASLALLQAKRRSLREALGAKRPELRRCCGDAVGVSPLPELSDPPAQRLLLLLNPEDAGREHRDGVIQRRQ